MIDGQKMVFSNRGLYHTLNSFHTNPESMMNPLNEEQLSASVTQFVGDPSSKGTSTDILQLHGYLRAATIVLTAEFGNPPTPQQAIDFSQVAALNDLKNTLR